MNYLLRKLGNFILNDINGYNLFYEWHIEIIKKEKSKCFSELCNHRQNQCWLNIRELSYFVSHDFYTSKFSIDILEKLLKKYEKTLSDYDKFKICHLFEVKRIKKFAWFINELDGIYPKLLKRFNNESINYNKTFEIIDEIFGLQINENGSKNA